MRYRTAPGREQQPPDPAAERRYPITVELTAREITALIDQGIIRPVVERVFPFESTQKALDFVEKGHAKGKVVVKVR